MGKTILVVEDSPESVELTRYALSECGSPEKLVVAVDGEEALDYMFGKGKFEGRDLKDMPELIMLDLKLPKLSGFDVLRQIRSDKRTRLVPVVVLTASRLRKDIQDAYGLGANSYLSKPLDYDSYVEMLGKVCEYWHSVNQNPYQ